MKETPYFSGKMKPVHVGLYKRATTSGNTIYSWWNGAKWYVGDKSVVIAASMKVVSSFQRWPWCGLAEDPNT